MYATYDCHPDPTATPDDKKKFKDKIKLINYMQQ